MFAALATERASADDLLREATGEVFDDWVYANVLLFHDSHPKVLVKIGKPGVYKVIVPKGESIAMHNFFQWCEEKQNDVKAVLADIEKLEGKMSNEGRARTGLRPAYPDGYYRNQYPDLYNTPRSATASLDIQNSKKVKTTKGAGNTPL